MNYFLNINNVHASIFEIILVKEQKQGVWGGMVFNRNINQLYTYDK